MTQHDAGRLSSYVASGLVLSGVSFIGSNALYFLTKLLLVRVLPVDSYGLIAYVWAVGATLGFLMMMGREQEALVQIPTADSNRYRMEWEYLARSFVLTFFFGQVPLFILRMLGVINDLLWGVLGFALAHVFFQMASYSVFSRKMFGRHAVLNIGANGGALILLSVLYVFHLLNTLLTIVVFLISQWLSFILLYSMIIRNGVATTADNEHGYGPIGNQVWNFRRFSRSTAHYFFVDVVATIVPVSGVLVLEASWGLTPVAILSFALLIYRVSRVFSTVVFMVFSPLQAESYLSDTSTYARTFHDSLGLSILFQGLLTIVIVVFCDPVVLLLAGSQYMAATTPIIILLAAGVYDSLYQVSASVLRTSSHSDWLFRVNCCIFVINIVLTALLVPLYGVMGAVFSFSVTVFVQGILPSAYLCKNRDVYPSEMRLTSTVVRSIIWCTSIVLLAIMTPLVSSSLTTIYLVMAVTLLIITGLSLRMFSLSSIMELAHSLIRIKRHSS